MARNIHELNKRLQLGDDAQVREERQERLIKELRAALAEEKRRSDRWEEKHGELTEELQDAKDARRDVVNVLRSTLRSLKAKSE